MNKSNYMLDFLVVASTFEFVTHLNLKYLKPIENRILKVKRKLTKEKKRETFSWADSQATRPNLTPLPWLVGLTTPRSAHSISPFSFL